MLPVILRVNRQDDDQHLHWAGHLRVFTGYNDPRRDFNRS
jgi:hypothetical protein